MRRRDGPADSSFEFKGLKPTILYKTERASVATGLLPAENTGINIEGKKTNLI